MTSAKALWCLSPESVAMRDATEGEGVLVETLFTGISKGTEKLVFQGRVPETEYERMRAPAQEGAFPFPVKYGYCAVGRVVAGALAGQAVFALHPHQTRFRLSPDMLRPLPEGLPPRRAVLAANMETALTLLWDSHASAGDKIVIVGGGVVGALVAYLCARLPGADVTLVDINPNRAQLAAQLGCTFASPEAAARACDVVFHLSATSAGLATALGCAGFEATVVEGSWYGTTPVELPLGGAFHSQRLRLIGSQVGHLPADRARRWPYARRMAKALDLLADPVLDHLLSGETPFQDLPDHYGTILSDPETLCHVIRY